MAEKNLKEVFTPDVLQALFPEDRSDHFFEALYGDASEGAYDISLRFKDQEDDKLLFEFQLTQRKGKCLACNLTYGLPTVFSRHPIINIKGLVARFNELLPDGAVLETYTVGNTQEISRELHVVPFTVQFKS